MKPKISLRELSGLQETHRLQREQRFLSGTPRSAERQRPTSARELQRLTDDLSRHLELETTRIACTMASELLFGSSVTYYPRRPFALWRWRQPKGPIYGKSPAFTGLLDPRRPYYRSAEENEVFQEIADYVLPRPPAKNQKPSERFMRREWRRACRKVGLLPPGKALKGDEKRREQNPPGNDRP